MKLPHVLRASRAARFYAPRESRDETWWALNSAQVAAHNAPGQRVIHGDIAAEIERAKEAAATASRRRG